MNVLVTVVLLFIGLMSLKYKAFVLFVASVVAAVISAPRAWIYTLLGAGAMFALMYFNFPSWDIISLVIIAGLYSIMAGIEERKSKKEEIPPELLAYMLMGGGGRAYR